MTKPANITLCGLVIAAATLLVDSPDAQAGFCYGCGSNAATLGDNVQFEELNLNHALRGVGPQVKFRGAYLNGSPTELKVDTHNLLKAVAGGTYSGTAIKDLTIDLTVGSGSYQIRLFEFKVECSANDRECAGLWYWAAPHDLVPHYVFRVRKVSGFPKSEKLTTIGKPWTGKEDFLCRAERDSNTGMVGNYQHSAIIFIGDQYNPTKRSVEAADKDWFNLACAGTAIYKMHMLRHTEAGKAAGKHTTLDQRTAMLKAISADYCGDGKAWTGDGTPLDWTDAQNFFPDPLLNVTARKNDIEGIWSVNGALCLNTPRRLPKNPNPVWEDGSNCTDPAVRRTEVVSACSWGGRTIAPAPVTASIARAARSGAAIPKPRVFLPVARSPLTLRPLHHIPPCDDNWLATWNDPVARKNVGAYAVTLNVTRDANYCDPLP